MANDIRAAGPPQNDGATVPETLAILPLRDSVLFPQAVLPLGAGRPSSLRLLEEAVSGGRAIGVVAQRDPGADDPQQTDLHRVGTLATIHRVLKQPDGTVRLVIQGMRRFRIMELTQLRPYLVARVEEAPDIMPAAGDLEAEALARSAANLFRQVVDVPAVAALQADVQLRMLPP